MKDLQNSGFTPNCPSCTDIQNGHAIRRIHTDNCRLRVDLEYQEHDHPKWQAVKHMFKSDENFHGSQIDGEGAPSTPQPDPDSSPPLFGEATHQVTRFGDSKDSNDIGLDSDQDRMGSSDTMLNSDRMDVADLFHDERVRNDGCIGSSWC